jgi:hypothetical protein
VNEPAPRFWEVFFEVYELLPRQGPGSGDYRRGVVPGAANGSGS